MPHRSDDLTVDAQAPGCDDGVYITHPGRELCELNSDPFTCGHALPLSSPCVRAAVR